MGMLHFVPRTVFALWALLLSTFVSAQIVAGDQGLVEPLTLSVEARIEGSVASVKFTYELPNTSPGARMNLSYAIPRDSVPTGFSYWIGEERVRAYSIERQRARMIFSAITERNRDPALAEMEGKDKISVTIFPTPTDARLRVEFTFLIPIVNGNLELPLRGHKTPYEKFSTTVSVPGEGPLFDSIGIAPKMEQGRRVLRYERESYLPPERWRIKIGRLNAVEGPGGAISATFGSRPSTNMGLIDASIRRLRQGWSLTGKRGSATAIRTQRTTLPVVKLWAAAQIENLRSQPAMRSRVVQLSVAQGVPSPYTSWLAVPESERKAFAALIFGSAQLGLIDEMARKAATLGPKNPVVTQMRAELLNRARQASSRPDDLVKVTLHQRAERVMAAHITYVATGKNVQSKRLDFQTLYRGFEALGVETKRLSATQYWDARAAAYTLIEEAALKIIEGRNWADNEHRIRLLPFLASDAWFLGVEPRPVETIPLRAEYASRIYATEMAQALDNPTRLRERFPKLDRLRKTWLFDAVEADDSIVRMLGNAWSNSGVMAAIDGEDREKFLIRRSLCKLYGLPYERSIFQAASIGLIARAKTWLEAVETRKPLDADAKKVRRTFLQDLGKLGIDANTASRLLASYRAEALDERQPEDTVDTVRERRIRQLNLRLLAPYPQAANLDRHPYNRHRAGFIEALKEGQKALARAHESQLRLRSSYTDDRIKVLELEASIQVEANKNGYSPEASRIQTEIDTVRARMGDPLLIVHAPADANKVIARFPDGAFRHLRYNEANRRWEYAFDIPTHYREQSYNVEVAVMHRDGTVQRLMRSFVVDLTAPRAHVTTRWSMGILSVDLRTDRDVARGFASVHGIRTRLVYAGNQRWRAQLSLTSRPTTFDVVLYDRAHNRTALAIRP